MVEIYAKTARRSVEDQRDIQNNILLYIVRHNAYSSLFIHT